MLCVFMSFFLFVCPVSQCNAMVQWRQSQVWGYTPSSNIIITISTNTTNITNITTNDCHLLLPPHIQALAVFDGFTTSTVVPVVVIFARHTDKLIFLLKMQFLGSQTLTACIHCKFQTKQLYISQNKLILKTAFLKRFAYEH